MSHFPRISRAMVVTTAADGTFSGTWAKSLDLPPMLIFTAVNSDMSVVHSTSAPTVSGFAGKCWIPLIGLGITFVAPPAGTPIHVFAVTPTQ